MNIGFYRIFFQKLCKCIYRKLFGKLQLMATQVCFDTKTQAMQLFLIQKRTTVCVFCELRRFCNIFFQCLHRSSFRKPIWQITTNGNAIPFFALLETTVTGKNSPKRRRTKIVFDFCRFACLLPTATLQNFKGKLPTQKSEYISFDVFCGCAVVVQNKIGRLSVPGTGK